MTLLSLLPSCHCYCQGIGMVGERKKNKQTFSFILGPKLESFSYMYLVNMSGFLAMLGKKKINSPPLQGSSLHPHLLSCCYHLLFRVLKYPFYVFYWGFIVALNKKKQGGIYVFHFLQAKILENILLLLISKKSMWYTTHAASATWSLSCVQLCATLWTVACQAPLSMGILRARVLEWVAMTSSRGSSQPRDWPWLSCIVDS